MKLSVFICSHNPKPGILERTLEGLQSQSLKQQDWELLLIDNASNPALHDRYDLSWHVNGRVIKEDQLGLTPARIRGFQEARADLMLMVDDDNILKNDFLETTLKIAEEHPELGAWGASIEGDFEMPVPRWLRQELMYLAIRPIDTPQLSLHPIPGFPTPAGAGMTLRKPVVQRYLSIITNDSLRMSLDRKGDSLVSSGDTDLAMCAWDLGLGIANFPKLRLTHLISAQRMTVNYMEQLHESMTYSDRMMKFVRNQDVEPLRTPFFQKCKIYLRELLRGKFAQMRFFHAQQKGLKRAQADLIPLMEAQKRANSKL